MGKDMIVKEIIATNKLMSLLEEYYSIKERRNVYFTYDLGVKYTDIGKIPELKIYFDTYIMGDHIRVQATDDEIKEVLDNYANNLGFELVSFKYCGGVRNMGYAFEEDSPYFEGMALNMKKKSKTKTRKK